MSSKTPDKLERKPVDELEIGMYVSKLDRPWLGTPFLFQGFKINSNDDLNSLKETCEYVYIDPAKTDAAPVKNRTPLVYPPHKKTVYKTKHSAEKEITQAVRHYQESLFDVEQLLSDIQNNRRLNITSMQANIHACTESILRNPSAMLWLSRIKHADNYTAEHCINVAILAISLGRHMGFSREDLELLGLCGMLHDVGKLTIDPAILNKPGRLTPEEFDLIKQHTAQAKDILGQDSALSSTVVEAAYSHHERIDGKGYPRGIPATSFSVFNRIVTIVDAYDAITSQRCYSGAKTTSTALKILYENRNTQFDDELVIKFIECIGLYPPGCIVEMDDGEAGFVVSNDPDHRLYPRIALLLDSNKNPMLQHILDLKDKDTEAHVKRRKITCVHPDGTFGLSLEDFTKGNIQINTDI